MYIYKSKHIYNDTTITNIQLYKYQRINNRTHIQIHKYTTIHIQVYPTIRIYTHANTKNKQVYNYAHMQSSNCTTIRMYK